MKKQMRKAMLTTVCMLIVGVMCLTGVTYAWFTVGDTAKVNDFNVTVVQTDGTILLAMADPTSTEKLNFAGTEVTFEPAEGDLYPVSTVNPSTGSDFSFFKGTLASDNTLSAVADTKNYQEFTLWFYNPGNTGRTLYLDGSVSGIVAAASNGADYKTQLASRIGFTTYSLYEISDYQNVVPNSLSHTISTTQIIEPNATTRYNGTEGGKLSYKGLKAVIAEPTEDQEGKTIAQVEADSTLSADVSTTELTSTSAIDVISIPAKQLARVTVRIWVEGQDADCVNDVAGYDFKVSLGFKNKEVATAG